MYKESQIVHVILINVEYALSLIVKTLEINQPILINECNAFKLR